MRRLALIFMLCIALVRADYLGSWAIDDYLTIMATTHSPTTGAAAAASAITVRIYEDDTDTEIVSDQNMTAFDSVTGLYKYKPQLTTAAGFEAGKCYTALISATVGDVTAITTHTFQILVKTAAPTVGQIRTELATELGRIDAAISTRSSHDAAAVKTAIEAGGSSIAQILADTGELQTNQGNWLTATGFSTHSAADVKAAIEAGGSSIAQILADTGELQTNQGNWLTATGFSTHSAADVWAVATRALTDKAGFTLHSDYDAAKTAAQAGDEMDLVNAPNATAVAAIQSGLSTHSAADVWAVATRELTQTVGDATAANQTSLLTLATWIRDVTEGDTYIDTTSTPWQMVIHKKGDPLTELIRKNLFDVAGENLTSIDTVIGKQTEPE